MKKKTTLFVLAIIILLGLRWVYSTSYIDISVAGTSSSSIFSYSFMNQNNLKVIKLESKSNHLKKRVPRSSYEVYVTDNNGSYFQIVSTHAFLATSRVGAKLEQEKARKFVGNNPGTCMAIAGGTLLSYACGDDFGNINIHSPATATSPTYTTKGSAINNPGATEGLASTSDGLLALIHSRGSSESIAGHSIGRVGPNLSLTNEVFLSSLVSSNPYSLASYKNGFLVYDSSLAQAFYYPSMTATPQAVNLEKPKNINLQPIELNADSGNILRLFATATDIANNKDHSEVIVGAGNQSRHFSFGQGLTSASFCGNQKLCAVGAKNMSVFDISGKKAKLLYNINDVYSIKNFNNELLVANKTGVLNFNVDNRSGFYDYTFGDYRFIHLQTADGGYLLSLTNNKGNGVALLVNSGTANSDSIDKKIEQLQNVPEVKTISIYGRYIFIVPNLGLLQYRTDIQGYDYDPIAKKEVGDKINQAIDRLGIDRNVYTINILL